jgi:hypothetical protein
MSRNIVIYPNRGLTGATDQPYITFSGLTTGTISLVVEDDGSITFDGDTGSLFGISDNKDGLLHSVNDVSGLPIFQVYDDDRLVMGKWDDPTVIISGETFNTLIGSGLTADSTNTLYTRDLTVRGDSIVHSDTAPSGTVLNKGLLTEFNYNGLTGQIASNSNPSGTTGVFFGDLSNFPTVKKFGDFRYFGTGSTRTGNNTPEEFYRNKVVIQTSSDSDGMIIKPKSGDANGKLWFELNGNSVGQLYSDNGYWGFGLNNDGQEQPTTHVQIGGTGTTGTFRFLDGNEQSGYVMTSDNDGNVSWSASAGGGTFWEYGDGSNNSLIDIYGDHAIIGGASNTMIAGGENNSGDTTTHSFFGGGSGNTITESDHSGIIAGINNDVSGFSFRSVIIGGINNYLGNTQNSVILGGQNIQGTSSDTAYVPSLNIGTVNSTTPIFNLGIDSNGFVVTGTTGGGGTDTVSATTTTIDFTAPKIFHKYSNQGTGNISENLTGAKIGITQKIYHNDSVEPTYPAGWVLMGDGIYFTSQLNIIYAEWAEGSRVEYWYVQEQ